MRTSLSGKRGFLEAIGRIFRPRNCCFEEAANYYETARSDLAIRVIERLEHDTNVCTSVNLVPMSCVIIDVLLLFPPISTELISRVMRSLVKFVKSGRYNEPSCLCHDCVTRARGRERETRLAIFRDTVLPSRNSRTFLRDEVFDEDSGKKKKKGKERRR